MRACPKWRKAAVAATVLVFWTFASVLAFDVLYTLFVLGAWWPNYWLDRAHIARQYSQADPELGFVRKPFVKWSGDWKPGVWSEYRTDGNGFRNPPSLTRAEVVFLGDSYTEAAHVPEEMTFVRRAAAATGLSAANLGRGAYGPQQELIVLKRYGLAYQPRYVIWQVFPGNDLSDAHQFALWKKDPDSGLSLARRYFNQSLLRSLAIDSIGLPQRDLTPAQMRYADGSVRELYVRYKPYEPEEAKFGIAELRRVLAEASEICRARGIRFGVMVVPTMMRVMRPYLQLAGDHAPGQEPFFLEEYVSQWCGEIGCSYIDVLGPMQKAARGNRHLYIPVDEHLDDAGHEIVARAVTRWIRGCASRAR